MIGMMADLADDCIRATRELDSQRSDPVQFWKTLTDFRALLKSEYVQGRMWLRSNTYTERIVGFLQGTRVLQFGREYQVLRRPNEKESHLCQTHLAVVARGILTYLKAEFPECSIQAHFVCFELKEPQVNHLVELLRIMGWDSARSALCLGQYKSVFPRAHRCHKKEESILECWNRALKEASGPVEELADIVGFLTSFLISETECERTFAAERRQFDNRPKLSVQMRFAGLKVMVDGAPLHKLQRNGELVGNFWQSVQNRYAQQFGSKYLMNVKQRCDANVKRGPTEVRPGAGGKMTLTAVQRQRATAVAAPISLASVKTNVFGYAPEVVSTMDAWRQQQRTAVFTKLAERERKKVRAKSTCVSQGAQG